MSSIRWCLTGLLLCGLACRNGGAAEAPPPEHRSPISTTAPATTQPAPGEQWNRPRSSERQAERDRMVRVQLASRDIHAPAVLEAMRNVPRHWFVPSSQQRYAYEDRPLSIGEGQTISQPYIVALMTQLLELKPTDKVLEIGTGSGYQAAVLAELTPHVFSIEIVEPLARRAAEALHEHGYNTIWTRVGDGYAGWPEEAPFDAIIVTCAPDEVPPRLIEQLAPGGRMCIPVGGHGLWQRLLLITKDDQGKTTERNVAPVAFVPMTGDSEQ
jgi:protein-L-isoaspartate(D-aspartate) O-methyltransferase